MSKSAIRLEVEKALADIEYDKWHNAIHARIRRKATYATLSDKEQSLAVRCGECNQVFEFRIPAIQPINKETKQ